MPTKMTSKVKKRESTRFYDESYPPRKTYAAGTKLCLLQSGKKKVWFVVPKQGPTTVDWEFTGLKQNTTRIEAQKVFAGLIALGFERVL